MASLLEKLKKAEMGSAAGSSLPAAGSPSTTVGGAGSGGTILDKLRTAEKGNGTTAGGATSVSTATAGSVLNKIRAAEDARKKGGTGTTNPLVGATEPEKPKNTGNGIEYLLGRAGLGLVQGIEGLIDFQVGGLSYLAGAIGIEPAARFAEQVFSETWMDYSEPDREFNPGDGWKLAGDIAGGLTSNVLPLVAGAAMTYATGGLAAPGIIIGGVLSGISAGGSATAEAYQETGTLNDDVMTYGALSGAAEGAIELITGPIASAAKVGVNIAKSTMKTVGKEAVKTTTKQVVKSAVGSAAKKALKEVGKNFVSEAVEESLSAWVSPYIKQVTYDPSAKNASAGEIAYAGLVGGLTGLATAGFGEAYVRATNVKRGTAISNEGRVDSVLTLSEILAETGDPAATEAQEMKALVESLTTGKNKIEEGKKLTASQLNAIGALETANMQMLFGEKMATAADAAIKNADAVAERLNAYGYLKIVDGKVTVVTDSTEIAGEVRGITGDDIRAGYDASVRNALAKALEKNDLLRYVAASDVAGRLIMTASQVENTALSGTGINNQTDLNRFIEEASPKQKEALGRELGIAEGEWDTLGLERFNDAVREYRESGRMDAYRSRLEAINRAKAIPENEAKPAPSGVTIGDGAVERYRTDAADIAVYREGESYMIYDYDSGDVSRFLTREEMGKVFETISHGNANRGVKVGELPTLADVSGGGILQRLRLAEDGRAGTPVTDGQSRTPVPTVDGDAARTSVERVADLKKRIDAKNIDAELRERVDGYADLSEPNKSMIRKIVREGRVHGLSEEDILSYARVATRTGLNIEFDASLDTSSTVPDNGSSRAPTPTGEGKTAGFFDPRGNRIVVNPKAEKKQELILIHELDHAVRKLVDLGGGVHTLVYKDAEKKLSDETWEEIKKDYADQDVDVSREELLADEASAYYTEAILGGKVTVDMLLGKNGSSKAPTPTAKKILDFFSEAARAYSKDAKLSREARRHYKRFKAMFDAFAEWNKGRNAMTAEEARGKVSDSRFSLEFAPKIAENQREFLAKDSRIRKIKKQEVTLTESELEKAIAQTAEMVEAMSDKKSILPKDKVGKTLVKNGSYDISVENTTICLRTLSYNSFVDMVSEKIGRPLSQMESFLVSQKLYDIAKEPQCLYCYVSLDRKAYNDMLLRYIEQRDAAIKAYVDAGKPKLTKDSTLYKDFLNGRKPTDNMWDRYSGWIKQYNDGVHILTAEDIATEAKRSALFNSKDTSQSSQVKDMLKYAQSASWAKKQTDYVAYYDDILKLSDKVIKELNKHYGLRWYSFSDYSGAFIVENMQQITDAAIRGLKGLAYTKDTDFAKIFAPTGMNINISVYVTNDGKGGYIVDEKQSANIKEAIALREQYPNVGIVAVATDQQGVEWALNQEWSDVVIPFHTVRTGAQVAEFYDWTVFNEEQNDTIKDENLWDTYTESITNGNEKAKKKVSKMVYPSEHQNNKETYLRIIEERGLKPRFSSFLENPNYMKLVNETRQSESQTKPLKPDFALDAAKESFGKFVEKGGYYEGWYNDGIDVDGEAEIVAQDIREGKKANEVDYGRQDRNGNATPTPEQLMASRKKSRSHGATVDKSVRKSMDITPKVAEESGIEKSIGKLGDGKVESVAGRDAKAGARRAAAYSRRRQDMTVGQLRQMVARYTGEKVYTSREARETIDNIYGIFTLSGKNRAKLYEALWQGYNSCKTDNERAEFSYDMAEYITVMMLAESSAANPDKAGALETLSKLKHGIGHLTFNESQRADLRHVLDKQGYKKFLGRWGFRETMQPNRRRVAVDVFIHNLGEENPEFAYLQEMTPQDAILELDRVYERTIEESKATVGVLDDMPDAELRGMIDDIGVAIYESFKTKGEKSTAEKVIEARVAAAERKYSKLKQKYDELERKYYEEQGRPRKLLNLSYQIQKMKELRLGTFLNATDFKNDVFKQTFEILGTIEFRGDISPKKVRLAMKRLAEWYKPDNPVLKDADGQPGSGYYSEFTALMINNIAEGEGGLSMFELNALDNILRHATNIVESFNRVWKGGKWVTADKTANEMIGVADEATVLHRTGEMRRGGLMLRRMMKKYGVTFADPMSVFRYMDAYGNGFWTQMGEELRRAAFDYQIDVMEMKTEYDAFTESKKNRDYVKRASVEAVEYGGVKMSKLQYISLYMTMQRQQAQRGLAENGFSLIDVSGQRVEVDGFLSRMQERLGAELGIKKSPDGNWKISDEQMKAAVESEISVMKKKLSAKDLEFIGIIERALNGKCKELKSLRDKERLGYSNTISGYYYPIVRAMIAKNIDTRGMWGELDRASNISANKDTVRGAAGALWIESADTVFNRHIDAVARYAELSPVIDTINKLFNLDVSGNKNKPRSIRTATFNSWQMGSALGAAQADAQKHNGEAYLKELLADVQGIGQNRGAGETIVEGLRGGFAISALAGNPKVLATQLSSLFASTNIISMQSLSKGAALGFGKGVGAEVDEYCPVAKLRNYDSSAAKAQGVVSDVRGIGEKLMKPVGAVDRQVVKMLWGACQVEVERTKKMNIGTKENKIEAGKLLERVIFETQQNSVATEKSAAMRSKGPAGMLMKTLTMFSSDAMKGVGRVFDAVGEYTMLKAKKKRGMAVSDEQMKAASKQVGRSVGALVLNAVYMTLIARAFSWLYAKEEDEEDKGALAFATDVVGGMLGGLPIISDGYDYITKGYDLQDNVYDTLNDVLGSVTKVTNAAGKVITGEATAADMNGALMSLIQSGAVLGGIPVRNLRNMTMGLTRRFSPNAAYRMEMLTKDKNFATDFEKAVEAGDDDKAMMILGLLLEERLGTDGERTALDAGPYMNEILRMERAGYNVLPRTIGSTVTIAGEEVDMTPEERTALRARYSEATGHIEALVGSLEYAALSDEQKESAIRFIYDVYYDVGIAELYGYDRNLKRRLFSRVISVEKLALANAVTAGLDADAASDGVKVGVSKRSKVIAAINALPLTTAEKLLIIAYKGYTVKDGDIRGVSAERAKEMLSRYARGQGLTADEARAFVEYL